VWHWHQRDGPFHIAWIESDDVVNYCFPTTWPTDRKRRARIIGEWLKTEARYLAPDSG
jgi:hypothetical protein